MAITNRTTAEVYTLSALLENTLKAVLVYRSESRNPSRNATVDTQLAALKTALDATVDDAVGGAV